MRKIYYLFSIATILSIKVLGQSTFNWAKKTGSSGNDQPTCIATDASNNVYSSGFFASTVDFDPGVGVFNMTAISSGDGYINKLDVNGNFIWAKQLLGSNSTAAALINAITVDPSGNILATGLFNKTVDFDPGSGVFNMTAFSTSAWDIFVLKLDAGGNFIWAKQFGGSTVNTNISGYSIVTDATGNVYSTGRFSNTVDFDPSAGSFTLTEFGSSDIYISKLDASGNFVWAKQIGSINLETGYGITLDGSNNIYVTGDYNGTVDFDPGVGVFNLVSAGSTPDDYLVKLDLNGSFLWAKGWGCNTNSDVGKGVSFSGGNVYVIGDFFLTADFDPNAGVFNMTSAGLRDIFISKLDASGNFIWAKQMGGTSDDNSFSIATDASGNAFSTGQFQGTADFDPGVGTYTLTAGSVDIFVSKLSSNGNFAWAGSSGGASNDRGQGIAVSASGYVYVDGFFQSTADLNPNAGIFNLTSTGSNDIFIMQLADCAASPAQPSAISGAASVCNGAGSIVYSITAVSGSTSYTWSLPSGWIGSSSTNTISATPGTTGIFTVTASNACGTSPQQTLNVTVNPLPTITVNSGSICAGQSFTIVPSGANTYTIQGGNTVVTPTANASYTVIGTSSAGCVSSLTATSNINVNSLPNINATTSNTLLCSGQSATLTASGASSYTFNPGGAGSSIIVSPTVTTTYTISGTSVQGCNNSSVFTQSVSTCAGINQLSNIISEINVYPNPFSNKFTVVLNGTKQTIQVFNALGSIIFNTETENEKIEIDLGKESSGIYFIKVGTGIRKIIKD